MEFVGCDTCDKLIWIFGECIIIKNKIIKQVSPKIHINKVYPASTLGFVCSPHKYTCDILS